MSMHQKSDRCLNCGWTLKEKERFCPQCGQENRNININFGRLFNEFLSTYLAFDSRIGRSIIPFLFKPGFLTKSFLQGKRKQYVHPVRLYLVMSIFYFFILSLVADKIAEQDNEFIHVENLSIFESIEPATKEILENTLSEETIDALLSSDFSSLDSVRQEILENSSGIERSQLQDIFGKDLIGIKQNLQQASTTELSDNSGLILQLSHGEIDVGLLYVLKNDMKFSDQALVDTITSGSLEPFEKSVALKLVKIARSRKEVIFNLIVQNFPIMMLLLIPLFAATLKLLFITRRRLYIEHIIHALHLHAFAYLVYGVFLLFMLIPIILSTLGEGFLFLGFLLVTIYAYNSFQRLYGGRWFGTLFRFLSVGFVYASAIFIFFILEVLISIYLF